MSRGMGILVLAKKLVIAWSVTMEVLGKMSSGVHLRDIELNVHLQATISEFGIPAHACASALTASYSATATTSG